MSKQQWLAENLRPGEHYAGIILGHDDQQDYHLILLPGEAAEVNWNDAKVWAAEAGGELPTRREQALLYANLKDQFQRAWYWSCEQHAAYSDFAWGQNFGYGNQGSLIKDYKLCARAVRRISSGNNMNDHTPALTDAEIIELARRKMDNGLCLDRTARITRSTDAEIIAFARAILAAAPVAQPAASGAVDSQPSPTLPNTWHWVAEQEGVEYVEYHHGYQAPPYAVDVWEPLFTADQMREYAALSRAQAPTP